MRFKLAQARMRIIAIGSAVTIGVVALALLPGWRKEQPQVDQPAISGPADQVEAIAVVGPVTVISAEVRVRITEDSPLAEMRGLSYWLYRRGDHNWVPVAQMTEGYSPNGEVPGRITKPNMVRPQPAIGLSGPAEFTLPLPPDLVEGTYLLCHDVTKTVCTSFEVVAA